MKTSMKRLIALCLVLVMCVSVFSGSVIALEVDKENADVIVTVGSATVTAETASEVVEIPVTISFKSDDVCIDAFGLDVIFDDSSFAMHASKNPKRDPVVAEGLVSVTASETTKKMSWGDAYGITNADIEYMESDVLVTLRFDVKEGYVNGTYPITFAITENLPGNFSYKSSAVDVCFVPGSLTLTGGIDMLTDTNTVVTLENTSYEYTGSQIKPAVKSVVYGETTLTEADYDVSYGENVALGEGSVTVTGKGKYQGSCTTKFEITKAKQVIEIDNVTKTYAADKFELNATAKGAVSYEVTAGADVVSVEGNVVTMLKVGNATITVKAAETDEYEAATKDVAVEVTPATVSYKDGLNVTTKKYDGKANAEVGGTANLTGKVDGDEVTVKVTSAAFANVNAGEQTVNATIELDGADKGNYVLDTDKITLTGVIEKAAAVEKTAVPVELMYNNTEKLTFDAGDVAGLLTDAGEIVITNVAYTGVLTAELKDGVVSYGLVDGLTAADKDKTGTVTVTFTSANYETSTVVINAKVIDKTDVSAQLSFVNGTGVYTGEAHTYEKATTELPGEIKYSYSGNMTDVGTYTVTATYEDEKNFGKVTAEYTITAAEMVAPTATATKVYDGNATVAADQVTVVMPAGASYTYAVKSDYVSANVAESAGKVQIEVTLTDATAANYDFANGTDVIVIEADGKITAKEINVTAAPETAAHTYTGAAVEAAVVVTSAEAALAADDYVVTYKNNVNVGEAEVSVASAASSNYKFAAQTKFEIVKADAKVTIDGVTKIYDGNGFTGEDVAYYASFNDEEIFGEWTVVAEAEKWNAGDYTVDLKFVPDNKNLNEVSFTAVAASIQKNTLSYVLTLVEKSGVVLDEVEISFYGVNNEEMDGELTWYDEDGVEIEDTAKEKVEANTDYSFKFVPADSVNYEACEDTVMLYEAEIGVFTSINITSGSTKHGNVTVNPYNPESGDKVVITVKPDAGYEVEKVVVTDDDGDKITVKEAGSNKYLFVMPAGQVDVKVTYKKANEVKFNDVAGNAWYADAVYSAVDMGLFTGVTDTTFNPDGSMTRGMLVTVLWRLEGSPAAGSSDFSDVANGSWYDEAVAWANEEGIVTGMTEDTFAPNAAITREQMATMLYRYAKYLGLNTRAKADLSAYKDADSISAYAEDAMAWAVGVGLINGVSETTLSPAGTATRAQVATILVRFVEKYL